MDESTLLGVLRRERFAGIGLNSADVLYRDRNRNLAYYRGDVSQDLPDIDGRSRVVSTDVRDAILSAMPDIMEIFTGEEIATFRPVSEEDTAAAEQETKVVNFVIHDMNDGWTALHDAIHDALLCRIGIIHFWVQDATQETSEDREGLSAVEVQFLQELPNVELKRLRASKNQDDALEPQFDATIVHRDVRNVVKLRAVAPERFVINRDADCVERAYYCAMEAYATRQDLLSWGFDADKVQDVPGDSSYYNEASEQERDLNGEYNILSAADSSLPGIQRVRLYVHNLKADLNGEGVKWWRIVTGGDDAVLLDKVPVNRCEFAIGSPIRQPHRAIGYSLADMLIEIQQIKTSVQRGYLDHLYFGLNARFEVAENQMSATTLEDLQTNVPGMPVRSKNGNAVRPLTNGSMSINPQEVLEYFSVVGEERSGVTRAGQGLAPDALHETRGGMLALLTKAQRRIRFMAKSLAQTLVKDLYLGVHDKLREYGGNELAVRINNKYETVNPSAWGVRHDMTLDVSNDGRDADVARINNLIVLLKELIQLQGGLGGPIVNAKNAYNAVKKYAMASGVDGISDYLTDPGDSAGQEEPPEADPRALEAQAKMQLETQKFEHQRQLDAARLEEEFKLKREQAQAEYDLALRKIEAEAAIAASRGSEGISSFRPGGDLAS